MEIGSIADWVSGVGSLLAVIFVIIQMERDKNIRKEKKQNDTFNSLELKATELNDILNDFVYKFNLAKGKQRKNSLDFFLNDLNNAIRSFSLLSMDIETFSISEKLQNNIVELMALSMKLNEYNQSSNESGVQEYFDKIADVIINIRDHIFEYQEYKINKKIKSINNPWNIF